MVKVRKSTFETNSSSTHSLVMAIKSDFDKWQNGELYYCLWGDKKIGAESGNFYTKEQVIEFCRRKGIPFESEDEDDDWCERREDFVTYDEFCDTEYLEIETYSYKTPSGETIKAVAKYGYDG